jgi:hypothetical protein
MKFMTFGRLILLVVMAGALTASPTTDISGKWTAETFMEAGGASLPVPTTFTFKVDGGKLTGSMKSSSGTFEIEDGKVEGDITTFSIVINGAKMLYDGKISEEGIDFIVRVYDRDRSDQFVATRVSE